LSLNDQDLASRAGVSVADLDRVNAGEIDADVLSKFAAALNLGAKALVDAANKAWQPQTVAVSGLETFTTNFEDMTVNSYLVWDASSKKAVAFDSGADASGMLDFATANGLSIELILITHTHGDHIFDLDRLREKTGAPVWVGDREPALAGAEPFAAGKSFQVGALTIESRLTWGHADGGITYVVNGLPQPVAIVGDAIFAGSMGGGKVSYADALRTSRDEILSLPGETVLASGHGPLTTVAEQKLHNPFFTA
jgi:glyoxylase-like metal-dependent hydrolase (beta-lactamase superfamily II)